jgi:hypothetical protein
MSVSTKYPNIVDVNGKEWGHADVVEFYKKIHVAPLLRSLQNKLSSELNEFERTTGLSVVLSPVLVWGQAYQEGCELILKYPPQEEGVYNLPKQRL